MPYNIKLILEYDGTNFHGWQRQANLPTIEGILEEALTRITKQPTKIIGAGRTDSGVHAIGQVANFKSTLKLSESSWVKAINSHLPQDITIKAAEYVPIAFHARYSAKKKVYQYLVLNSGQPSPFLRNYAWHIRQPLHIPLMKDASHYLIGTHDFSSFRASACSARSPVRTLDRFETTLLEEKEGALPFFSQMMTHHDKTLILFSFEARSYLQHMVRNIVGTLIDVGKGRIPPFHMRDIMEKKDRRYAGPIAPPEGLFLTEIKYD